MASTTCCLWFEVSKTALNAIDPGALAIILVSELFRRSTHRPSHGVITLGGEQAKLYHLVQVEHSDAVCAYYLTLYCAVQAGNFQLHQSGVHHFSLWLLQVEALRGIVVQCLQNLQNLHTCCSPPHFNMLRVFHTTKVHLANTASVHGHDVASSRPATRLPCWPAKPADIQTAMPLCPLKHRLSKGIKRQ